MPRADINHVRPYRHGVALRLLKDTPDGGCEEVREEHCEACGALMRPRSAEQIIFTVRPDDEAPEDDNDYFFICPDGCAQCECDAAPVIKLGARCPYCEKLNNAH